jgi:2,5-dihydroxypyridine 5,6-dioxygenase
VFEAALRRASTGGLGSIIHFSHGFHPRARFTGKSFNEDIRVRGNDAIGFGTPWWEEGVERTIPTLCVPSTVYISTISS